MENSNQTKKFKLSNQSLNNLKGVNPDLIKIVKRAIEITKQDFKVTEGLRTHEQCCINYGKGRTKAECRKKNIPDKYSNPNVKKVTWLNNPFSSKHVSGKAIDLVPYPVDWNDTAKFEAIADAMKKAAKENNIVLIWGGDWKKTKDLPHFEI